MKKPLATVVGFLVIAGVMFIVAGRASVAQAAEPHPHIYKAYRLLRRSHYVLRHGCRELGGHRSAAVRQVDLATDQLKAAIAMDHGTLPAVEEAEAIQATPGQAHAWMYDALRQCNEARAELAASPDNFGGHRVKAIQYVDAAVAQLQLAVKEPACH